MYILFKFGRMMLKIVGCCKFVIIIKYPAWIYDFQDIQQKTIQDGIKKTSYKNNQCIRTTL